MELIASAQAGSVCSAEMEILSAENERRPVEIHWSCLRDEQSAIVGVLAAFLDITDRQRAAADLAEVNARLVEASRRAGMAEIATNVLHNVGNAFNSVNVSVTVVTEKLLASKIPRLRTAANLLNSHGPRLPLWLSEDERGKHFAPYLDNLTTAMEAEQAATLSELRRLGEHIEHIKQIITTQQAYAKTSGVSERFSVRQIVEKCVAMEISALTHSAIQLDQEIPVGLDVIADRHKTLQILANLVRNARDAILDAQHGHGIIKITAVANGDRVLIRVTDNGSGIAPEHLTKIFAHGFTTRTDGHGFGLHGSALAAMEMKGALTAGSPGKGAGATFTLTLPAAA
jgi:signal transduction histidine kinase